ncbi:hypothetical protein MATL_G00056480 [Megalops atlanticus]|uniref:Uncharacterized protein n=1 Tax=Megalops atlanticus TaxID=7932 RepID=A0A9D3TFK2_MEGAT|nr:hypothetical protein MATL_G00056480 [Megalops atlanticus]
MTLLAALLSGFGLWYILTSAAFVSQAHGLQCYGCNVIQGQKYVDVGCSSPVVITCSQSHKGFKQRFCIRTESTALGILLTSGCATSRHCHQQELPGVRIQCCDTDLCNSALSWRRGTLHYLCALASLLLLWLQL